MSDLARRRHAAITDWDQAYDNRAAVGQDAVHFAKRASRLWNKLQPLLTQRDIEFAVY